MRRPSPLVPILLLVFAAASLSAQSPPTGEENVLGKKVYDQWCEQCHGDHGQGDGEAAPRVKPKPRDFTAGKYKVRSTLTGQLPTDADLKNAIRRGLYYSAMPAFSNLSETEVDAVIEYIKGFSPDFADPDLAPTAITIPEPPPYDPERAATVGKEIYEQTGCGRCHGTLGRGDGNSAPTLKDDWGDHVRIADLTMPWTFRGGGSRKDIYRTMSTGFFGTPMPGFYGNLFSEKTAEADAAARQEESDERMWAIVDYMYYLAGLEPSAQDAQPEAPYGNQMKAVGVEGELDPANDELFAAAPETLFPILGQVTEPGRNFYPSIYAVSAQAVFNDEEIAFRITWHDMRAETAGSNAPDVAVPLWDDELAALGQAGQGAAEEDEGGGFWDDDDEEEGDFWGVEEDDSGDGSEDSGGDFWGDDDEEEDAGGFWGDDDEPSATASGPGGHTPETEFSDAVALQFPLTMPTGIRRPYFLFGDAQNPVELWFRDLATEAATAYVGRGSAAIAPSENEPPESVATFDEGQWTVVFKRQRLSRSSISFEEGTFVPIAFSVWDGFNRERGNKRGLTGWRNVYIEPREKPSPWKPMAQAAGGVLILELLIIGLVRRRHAKNLT